MKLKIEHNAFGKPVARLWDKGGQAAVATREAPHKPGHCVYCKRAKSDTAEITLCEGLTMNCEQHVWMESRKLRGVDK